MTKQQEFKKILYDLLQADYAINLEGIETDDQSAYLLFYHLSSVYNGYIYIIKNKNYININWQYHKYSTKIDKKLDKLCKLFCSLPLSFCKDTLKYFYEKSKIIFDAKYSLEIDKYIYL